MRLQTAALFLGLKISGSCLLRKTFDVSLHWMMKTYQWRQEYLTFRKCQTTLRFARSGLTTTGESVSSNVKMILLPYQRLGCLWIALITSNCAEDYAWP